MRAVCVERYAAVAAVVLANLALDPFGDEVFAVWGAHGRRTRGPDRLPAQAAPGRGGGGDAAVGRVPLLGCPRSARRASDGAVNAHVSCRHAR